MSVKKFKFQAKDVVFDDVSWESKYLPKIQSRIEHAISKIPQNLVDKITLLEAEISSKKKSENEAQLEELVLLKTQLMDILSPSSICKKIMREDFEYEYIGMISEELIEKNKEFLDFDWTSNLIQNNYSSSWGIFNNHLIINKASIKFHEPMTLDFNIFSRTGLTKKRVSVLFTNILPDLSFVLEGTNKWGKKYSIFENRDFSKRFRWSWTNDTEVLMYFTPYFQEQFLRLNKELIKPEFYIHKTGSFIFNEYNQKYMTTNYDASSLNLQYLNNYFMNINSYIEMVAKDIIDFCHDKYCSLAFATIIPIIDSEYQTRLINKLIADTIYVDVTKNANRLIQYLIAENKIIQYNTPDEYGSYMYHEGEVQEKITKKGNDYAIIEVMAVNTRRLEMRFDSSHNKVSGFELQWAINGQLPLQSNRIFRLFDEFTKKLGYLYTSKIRDDVQYHKSYYWNTSNIDEASTFELELIYEKMNKEYGLQHLIIDNGYICFLLATNTINETYIDQIIKIISKCEVQSDE